MAKQASEKIDPHAVQVAYAAGLRAYCAVKQYNERADEYLCNFGYSDVWTPAAELSRLSK
jgi:hypothetical protein